jgi:hypothetical protein
MCSSPNITRMIKSMCRRCGIESQEGQEINMEFHLKKQTEHLADLDTILRPIVKFTTEVETDSAIPFLNVLVIRKLSKLDTKVCRKNTLAITSIYN